MFCFCSSGGRYKLCVVMIRQSVSDSAGLFQSLNVVTSFRENCLTHPGFQKSPLAGLRGEQEWGEGSWQKLLLEDDHLCKVSAKPHWHGCSLVTSWAVPTLGFIWYAEMSTQDLWQAYAGGIKWKWKVVTAKASLILSCMSINHCCPTWLSFGNITEAY